jgi:hypothetical protein
MSVKRGRLGSGLGAVLIAALAAAACARATAPLPAPEEVFGFPPGADRRLADYGQITTYFERLARRPSRSPARSGRLRKAAR